MPRSIWIGVVMLAISLLSFAGCAQKGGVFISQQEAIEAALAEVDGDVLGIRFDEPDAQWDVFIGSGDQAYEVEVDAVSGKIVAAEAESLEEIQAELSGDLSHEGVEGDVD